MSDGFEVYDERFKALLLPDSRLQKLAGRLHLGGGAGLAAG